MKSLAALILSGTFLSRTTYRKCPAYATRTQDPAGSAGFSLRFRQRKEADRAVGLAGVYGDVSRAVVRAWVHGSATAAS